VRTLAVRRRRLERLRMPQAATRAGARGEAQDAPSNPSLSAKFDVRKRLGLRCGLVHSNEHRVASDKPVHGGPCRSLRDASLQTPPGPEGSNGSG